MSSNVTIERRQSLIDLSVQEYGGKWLSGLIDLQRNNSVNLIDKPIPGSTLKVKNPDRNDPTLIVLSREKVKVATGVFKEVVPSNLIITGIEVEAISLAWDGAEGASQYIIERKEGLGLFEVIDTISSDLTTYDDENL